MTKIVKTYRGVDEELIKEVQHLSVDTGRTEGDLINEALMLLVRAHEKKAKKRKK